MICLCLPSTLLAQECTPTAAMFSGTHHNDNIQHKVDISTGLVFEGHILSATDCKPIPGAKIEHWQTNSEGFYVDRLRAWMRADTQGYYRFSSEWPGAPVPHVHFIVSADGYTTLTTQWQGDKPRQHVKFDIVLVAK